MKVSMTQNPLAHYTEAELAAATEMQADQERQERIVLMGISYETKQPVVLSSLSRGQVQVIFTKLRSAAYDAVLYPPNHETPPPPPAPVP